MTKRKVRSSPCANTTVPPELTEKFVSAILNLPSSVRTDYLKEQFRTKFVSESTTPASERRQRAIDKWLATEIRNEETNLRLLSTDEEHLLLERRVEDGIQTAPPVSYGSLVSYCRSHIAKLIGETVPLDSLVGEFSGGASTSRNRTSSHPAEKYLGEAHATQEALNLFVDLAVDGCPSWLNATRSPLIKVVAGNVMFTVPKNADIDRPACKEPDINMWFQKGIGAFFRKRLRRAGINLNDQSINRSLALEGSQLGHLATLDLSSASDSVTTSLVWSFLPECWYTIMDSVRSPVTMIDGEEHRNEMMSSMGNGYTFELESMLFWSITRAVCRLRGHRGAISVYGDDIICPSSAYDDVVTVLGFFGFQVNEKKSFSSGPFRESCGGHYHNGVDITPFYLRGPLSTLVDLIQVLNQLRQWAGLDGSHIHDLRIEEVWFAFSSYIPKGFWGGTDTANKYQLVAHGVTPRVRLTPRRKTMSTGLGGYLFWLNATWARDQETDGVQTSFKSIEDSFFRSRPVRVSAVTQLPLCFLREV